jgi:hypothetical protein
MEQLQALQRALEETPTADEKLAVEARAVQRKLRDIQEAISGDPTVGRRQEPAAPSLMQRISGIAGRQWSNTLDTPTATQRRQYEIVAAEFGGVLDRLRALIDGDVKRLEAQAEAAGAPWTSGRIPTWKP